MNRRKLIYTGLIILGGLLLSFFDIPADVQKNIAPYTPQAILDSKINLGLDLQGGSQLDYKIDLRKVPEGERNIIVDGILNVINKRVNSLGVAEPNIYTSDVGDEKHLIVELAGIKDLEEAKDIVGKTIQLEFKEQKDTPEDPELEAKVKEQAQGILDKILEGEDFKLLAQEEEQAYPGKVFYSEVEEFAFKDEVPTNLQEVLFSLEAGETNSELVDNSGNFTVDASGNVVPGAQGFFIVQVTEKQETEKTNENPRSVKTSHILIAYSDVNEDVERTEEEAKTRAQEVIQKLKDGKDFTKMAEEYSDDKGSSVNGGALPDPVIKDEGTYVKEYETASLELAKVGDFTEEPVKSPFGFHIIKADEITEASSETTTEPQIKYRTLTFSAMPDPWQETGLSGQHFSRADVEFTPTYQPYVAITFNDEGAKLFEDITRRNVGKPVAIFVGGNLISAPNVNEVIAGGRAQITGQFTVEEAQNLARDLNTGAIPAPIILAGQYTIGATLGQDALQKSLSASLIGFALIALFMILYYRLPGLLATIALGVYAAILIFLIKVAMPIGWALGISVLIFIYLVMKILKNKESGPEKAITGILACFILFFATFIFATPIVLTLAGVAGVILSIGMAVDANILIFERIKEELRDGRSLAASIEVGFDRAWSSIRDSNFSSLITCGILFYFGSSIIQGFAFNLAAGILVSMFTAITITKTFLETLSHSSVNTNSWLFGTAKKKERSLYKIIQKRKNMYFVSGIILAITVISIPIFGMKLGLDFTGGTLMEIQFEKEVTTNQIRSALVNSQDKIVNTSEEAKLINIANAQETEESTEVSAEPEEEEATTDEEPATEESPPEETLPEEATASSTESDSTLEEYPSEPVDLSKALIIPSENGYIIKTPHISTVTHDKLLEELKIELGEFEETRFSTVGPTVGASLQQRAIFAVLLAVGMIILYIAFAFRRVPRRIGKWRFGLTAIAALIHDLGIMICVYIYLGLFLGVEIDALFITAMLTVLGFSVHDTIVVFDRIRENLKHQKREETFAEVTNKALNETLARSLNTSISTLLVLGALAILGAESIRYFVIALIVGIISGTYSSIFVATPLLVDWQERLRKKKS